MAPYIGLGQWVGKSGGRSWTPKNIESKILFWGLYSDISGGHMPNKVTGSSDYLTVSGSAGSETYQCPNTQSYIDADADFIWFKRSTAQRTTTEAELIGYDFTKTFVKYGDTAPNSIEEIWILKAGESLTTDEENKMRDYCHLSVWWSGVLSLFGVLKSNRGAFKQGWITPSILKDGNTVGNFYFNELATITKDGSNKVANVNSFDSLGYAIAQADAAKKMTWSASGFIADLNKSLQSQAFAFAPPCTIYLAMKQNTWNNAYRFLDSFSAGNIEVMQIDETPRIKAGVAGYYSADNGDLTLNTFKIVTIQFNPSGTNSFLQIGDNAPTVWNLCNGVSLGGILLGARYNLTYGAYATYMGAVYRKVADSPTNVGIIKAMLKERFEL